MTNKSDETFPPPGRPVILEPTLPGLWSVILGVSVAVLAPLFGFLVGSAMGPGDGGTDMSPLFMGLFVGVVIGGIGVIAALAGGWRMYRDWMSRTS